jgi:hypothetical protein
MKAEGINRNLLWALLAVVVVAAIFWGTRLLGGSSPDEDAQLKDLPKKPENLQPVTPEEQAAVPGPVDLK